MSEHGWPDDHHDIHHHDDGDAGGLEQHEDLLPADDPVVHHEDDFWDHHDDTPEPEQHTPDFAEEHHTPVEPAAEVEPDSADAVLHTLGVDPDALPEPGDDAADLFPAAVDLGPLPEPVDGFPWIDTGSLGVVDQAMLDAAGTPDPAELADYAATDLPPGADPWAALEASEDPAVSALAKFWGSGAGPDQA